MSNKYTYSVPFTEEQVYDLYFNQRMTQKEIAEKFGTSQKVVWRAMQKMGLKSRPPVKRNQKGANNSAWKGGRVLMAVKKGTRFSSAGYWYIYLPEHPNATKSGYVAEHIVVATKAAGRPLQNGEHVHHVDLNKHNNAESNLVICTCKKHREFHLQLEHLSVLLYRQGLVVFDPAKGYSLSEGLHG